MNTLKWLAILVAGAWILSCVPSAMHTAEVKPGNTVIIGAGPCYRSSIETHGGIFDSTYKLRNEGPGILLEASWLSGSERLAFVLSTGIHTSWMRSGDPDLWPSNTTPFIAPGVFLGLGLQWECQENPSVAIRIMGEIFADYNSRTYPNLSVSFLRGINSTKTNREIITMGIRTSPLGSITSLLIGAPSFCPSAFITIHPTKRLHISTTATIGFSSHLFDGYRNSYWIVNAGIGYSILSK